MSVDSLMNSLIGIFASYGLLGAGWLIAFVMLAYFIRSLKAKDKELMQIKTQHINDVTQWSAKLELLHSKQNEIVTELNDRRVDDLKELVEDYNEIATSMVSSLDKLANSIKTKHKSKD